MKVKSNNVSYQLSNNGVSESSGNDGIHVLSITFSVESTETFSAVKTNFTKSMSIYILDDKDTITNTYSGYITLNDITYHQENDTVTVTVQTLSDMDLLKAQMTETQEAIATLAGGTN